MKTKKKSAFSKLMEFAGNHKYFSYISCVLAVISAWIALIPFYDVWCIIKEVLEVRPDFSKAVHITSYGWQAVGFALLAMVFYIASLMCSHKAAFRVQANMRVYMMEHIMKLPLGYVESKGTGKIRKIVTDSSSATETYLAHNLPDKAVSYATPIGLLAMMAVFDWRLGLISLIPAVLAFVIMGTMMMGPKMAEDMKQYQNSLETMSAEAVEYVRGVPVLKTFGQTVFSFKRFKAAIDDYEKWTIDYTKAMMLPMIGFTVFSNAIFAALIIAAYVLCGNTITDTFLLNLIFYILITATLTTTLMKVAYAGESQMIVEDALNRMDEILDVKELPNGTSDNKLKDASVSLKNVKFSYDDAKTNAIDGISLDIKAGEHIAFVGPSGGGKTTLASLIARFWDVNSGSISIGGVDVKDIESDKLMDTISYVFQDSRLLKTSILENVRMGRLDASDAELIGAMISTTLIVIGLFFFNWKMALAAVWVMPIAFIIVLNSRKALRNTHKKTMKYKLACQDGIQEGLETIRDLRANNMTDNYMDGLESKIRDIEKHSIVLEFSNAAFVCSAQMILKFGIGTVALVGSTLLIKGEIDVLTLFVFLLVVTRMYEPLQIALQNLSAMISLDTTCERMDEILSHDEQTGKEELTNNGYDITFENVGFSYEDGKTVLSDVDFVAKQGEVTALIGPSGGGKTTVSRLAARFWDCNRGKISIGGMDVSEIEPESLLSLYSIVFQDVTLFNNTITENIRVGKKDATDEEVMAAAKLANCTQFIEKLPDKWNTMIGENGSELSGGERQRISIARAFLKDAPIILMDEATASLDVDNESVIQESISKLIKDKTVLIIAHRMRTVDGADKIVVLKDGVVAEQGTPKELKEQNGIYKHMFDMQLETQNWKYS